jgi:hypothetical protein
MHPAKRFGGEGLGPKGEPVDSSGAPGCRRRRGHIVGVGLERDLRAHGERPIGADPIEQRLETCRVEAGWRAAAKVDRFDDGRERPGRFFQSGRPFPEHSLNVGARRYLSADCNCKVAVTAAARAEGDVDVEMHE